jgi:Tfp pilus assembly protein PilV
VTAGGFRRDGGESLIVVVLAMAIFSIVLTGVVRLRPAMTAAVHAADHRTMATLAAQSRLEVLKARPEALRTGRKAFAPAGMHDRKTFGVYDVVKTGQTAAVTVTVWWGLARGERIVLATFVRVP